MAAILDSLFAAFDYAILSGFHNLAISMGAFLTPIAELLAFMGDLKFLLAVGAVLLIFPKTRKMGIMVLIAALGVNIINNVVIKMLVARPRPYVSSQVFNEWWSFVGGHVESQYSFPSGHTAGAMAVVTAIFMNLKNKKITWPIFGIVVLMGASRNYLMVHYPSDVLGGVLIGFIAAWLTWLMINHLSVRKARRNSEK